MITTTIGHRLIINVLLCGALAPTIAIAEGAVKLLSCEATQHCDAAGQCQPHQQTLEFRMEPIALHGDGSGEFTLRYEGEELTMQALSEAGPFVWRQQQHRYTLLANSETQFLLHTLTLSEQPGATLLFLTCTFRQ